MIKEKTAVSLAEVKEILSEHPQIEENNRAENVLKYIKKFVKTKPEKAKALLKGLEDLDLIKLKREHLAKIVDLMPEDAEDLKKIFVGSDVSLDQDEINSILERVKQEDGVPACEQHFVCNRVCPRGVKPGTAIKQIRDKWMIDE